MTTFISSQKRMRSKRRKLCPPVPHSFTEVRDMLGSEDWRHLGTSLSVPNLPFFQCLLQGENDIEILVFVSPVISERIRAIDKIHVDGTFKIVPHGFKHHQLFIVHIVYLDMVFPVAYALMSHRTEEAYVLFFTYLKSYFMQFQPKFSMSDYEPAVRGALTSLFPDIIIKCCWFHFAKAIWEYHKTIGMTSITSSIPRAKKIVQMMMSLPLLPSEKIRDGVAYLQGEIDAAALSIHFARLMSYINSYWLQQVGTFFVSVFELTRRTNNDVENFNLQIFVKNNKIPHPAFWDFIRVLLETDRDYSLKFQSHERDYAISQGKRNIQLKQDQRIRSAEAALNFGTYTVGEFLEHTAHSVSSLERQLRGEAPMPQEGFPEEQDSELVDDPANTSNQ